MHYRYHRRCAEAQIAALQVHGLRRDVLHMTPEQLQFELAKQLQQEMQEEEEEQKRQLTRANGERLFLSKKHKRKSMQSS